MSAVDVFFTVGGWWQVEKFDDMTGAVSVEIGSMRYLQAQDNGLFIVGPQHNIGSISVYTPVKYSFSQSQFFL